MNEGKPQKRLYTFTNWNQLVKMSIPIENVGKLKVRWLHYETQSTGNRVLKLSFKHLGSSGIQLFSDGQTDDYFFATPLDTRANVGIYFENFTEEYDLYFDNRIPEIWNFAVEIKIDDEPASDVSSLNPLIVEFTFN